MPTYYDLLGVPPDAPLSEIQAGYDMQRRHAEWSGSPDPVLLAQYDAAWQVLSDPARRRAYDQSIGLGGPAPVGPGGGWGHGTRARRLAGRPAGVSAACAARHRLPPVASARTRE